MNFSTKEILCILPHKFPFLLIDKVIDCVPGESATGIKNVTINEPCFQGHFPTEPIFPGVLTIEVIAQTIAVMYGSEYLSEAVPSAEAVDTAAASHIGYLVSSNIKFMKPIIPGDTLAVKVKHKATVQNLMSIDANVEVNGFVVAKGNLGVSKKP